jgi:basic membrane protein A
MYKKLPFISSIIALASLLLTACGGTNTTSGSEKSTVGVVLDTGGENDKSFNEYTLKGAKDGAKAAGLNFFYLASGTSSDYEKNIELQISEGADLIITVGFLMGDATAAMAKKYPNVKFAIIDNAYPPGKDGVDPYTKDLKNVTSLMFAENQVGYLAGTLAGCMSETGKVATVSGMEIPPVKNFVVGFQKGAKSVNPKIVTFNQYIPDFNDPATGKTVGQNFINQGADVIFGVGGNTGNGGLLAAKEAGKKAIGVDVDQYLTYPEIKDALITSATKRMDVATLKAVKEFAQGKLKPGIELATIASGGLSLAPYHNWESKIPQTCKDKVKAAELAIKNDPKISKVN